MKTIDASHGGGQVLRTALSLSAMTGQPIKIQNIRIKRPKPGLQAQHLACVNAIREITSGAVEHDGIGSTHVILRPTKVQGGNFTFDIGTAGSCTLLLQCILPPLLFADKKSTVTVRGGTDVPFSPPSLFLERIFLPAIAEMGANVTFRVEKHGFYPKGQGILLSSIEPIRHLKPFISLNRGTRQKIRGYIKTSQLPEHVAQREKAVLAQTIPENAISIENVKGHGPGNVVFLESEYENIRLGFDQLGKIGTPAEAVAEAVLKNFNAFDQSPDAIETHVLDQLLIYAALADGASTFGIGTLSEHAQSNLKVIHELLGTRHHFNGRRLDVNGVKPLSTGRYPK